MRVAMWVAICAVQVLAACEKTAAGDAAAPDVAADVVADVPVAAADGCGAACDASDAPDVPDVSDALDAALDAAADVAVDAAADGDAAADVFDCTAVLTALQTGIDALATGHQACQHDSDCTTVPTSTACQGTCGIGVNVAFLDQFKAGLEALNTKLCVGTGFTDACGYASPKCMAPNPGCVNSQCVYKK